MRCAWKELLNLLPQKMRQEVDMLGREGAQELRLRVNSPPELVLGRESRWLSGKVQCEELSGIINAATRYSPWAAATISRGYLTAQGGHRIGICGEVYLKNDQIAGIRNPTALCIRIARDYPGIGRDLAKINGSILILGAPGWGKTTLLRDLIRLRSEQGSHISVVDEREELFPQGFDRGRRTEVLSGCPKAAGLDMLLRTMGPDTIALDEVTAGADCEALQRAAWCGVNLLATAHAASLSDYLHREIYAPLVKQNLFETIVVLHRDKSWHLERSGGWTTNGSARC